MTPSTSARISLRDESDLTWFWCHGQQRFQRSVHGAMADRLDRDSTGAKRCFCCHGVGIVEDERMLSIHRHKGRGTEVTRKWVAVRGKLEERADESPVVWSMRQETQAHDVTIGSYCQFCNGTGWLPARIRKSRCSCFGMGKRARVECSECLGTGRPQPTALPTHHDHEECGNEVDGDTLNRFARISRCLEKLSTAHRMTLERYYGPHGQSWACEPEGRLLGLEEFTASGKRLLKRTRVKGDEATGASAAERLASQHGLQRTDPEPWRRELLDSAVEEASRSLRLAQAAWVAMGAPGSLTEAMDAVGEQIDQTGEKYEALMGRNWEEGLVLREVPTCD